MTRFNASHFCRGTTAWLAAAVCGVITASANAQTGEWLPGDLPRHVNQSNDRVLGGSDGRSFGQFQQRTPDALLEADIQARRDQFRLHQQQRRQQEALAWQQEVQRQRDQAPVGERAMRQQQEQEQEQASRVDRPMREAQWHDFQRVQPPPLQLQRIQSQPFPAPFTQPQAQPQLLPPEAVGQQALREQAQRQQQSDERVRAQQAARLSRDPGARRGMPREP